MEPEQLPAARRVATVGAGDHVLATDESRDDEELHRHLREIGDELDGAIGELRDLAHGIYPSLLADLGLVSSLESVGRRTGRSVEVTSDRVRRYPSEIESVLWHAEAYVSLKEQYRNPEPPPAPPPATLTAPPPPRRGELPRGSHGLALTPPR